MADVCKICSKNNQGDIYLCCDNLCILDKVCIGDGVALGDCESSSLVILYYYIEKMSSSIDKVTLRMHLDFYNENLMKEDVDVSESLGYITSLLSKKERNRLPQVRSLKHDMYRRQFIYPSNGVNQDERHIFYSNGYFIEGEPLFMIYCTENRTMKGYERIVKIVPNPYDLISDDDIMTDNEDIYEAIKPRSDLGFFSYFSKFFRLNWHDV